MFPKWPSLFWNISSVISYDLRYNKWQLFFSTILMISGIYNCIFANKIVCVLEDYCDNSFRTLLKGVFTRVVALSCFLTRLVVILKGNAPLIRYKKNLDKFQRISPMTQSETQALNKVSILLVLSCLLLTLPVNIFKLAILFFYSYYITLEFSLIYIHNLTMFCVETHFSVLCFVLYQKFNAINRDLMTLKIDTIIRNKYPFAWQTDEKYREYKNSVVDYYNKEILQSLQAGRPMSDFIERLKIEHKLIREMVRNLNDMFGFHLGLSLCSLCLMLLFDMYYHLLDLWNMKFNNVLFYGWLLQYIVRFATVTFLAQLLTKQVILTLFFYVFN